MNNYYGQWEPRDLKSWQGDDQDDCHHAQKNEKFIHDEEVMYRKSRNLNMRDTEFRDYGLSWRDFI